MPRRLVIVFACSCLVTCSCGGGGGRLSDADATRAAIPAFETAWAQKTPEPTPTPVPPLVAIKRVSPKEITGGALYIVDIRSREIMQITGGVSLQAWLPDGRIIVGGGNLQPRSYLIDPETNVSPRLLPDWPLLAVSPNGQFAAASHQAFPSSDVATFPVDDPDAVSTVGVAGEVESVAWSAGSDYLAVATRRDLSPDVSVLVAKDGDLANLRELGNGRTFGWSSVGTQIALANAAGVTTFDLDSGEARERPVPASLLTSPLWQDLWRRYPPSLSWSPDSRYLAFSSNTTTFVFPVDGGGGVEMTGVRFHGWLADGSLLAVSGPMCSKAKRLMLVSVDGAVERTFDDRYIGGALPSPDGLELAAAFLTEASSSLELVDAAGANVVLLSTSRGDSMPIAWSSDGGKLAFGPGGDSFVCHQDYTPGERDIHPIQ